MLANKRQVCDVPGTELSSQNKLFGVLSEGVHVRPNRRGACRGEDGDGRGRALGGEGGRRGGVHLRRRYTEASMATRT